MTDEGLEQLRLYLEKKERLSIIEVELGPVVGLNGRVITVISFPIERVASGWRIANVYRNQINVETHTGTDGITEDIVLEKCKVGEVEIFAGYGEKTEALVIGVKGGRCLPAYACLPI